MYQIPDEVGLEKVSPRYWRSRGQRLLIDSVAAVVVLGCAVLLVWPGDDQIARGVGGALLLMVAAAAWVWLRIYNDRYLLMAVLIGAVLGLVLLLGVGSQAVQRIVVNATGEVHQAEVVHVAEEHVKGGIELTYTLTHIDGSAVCGHVSVLDEPRLSSVSSPLSPGSSTCPSAGVAGRASQGDPEVRFRVGTGCIWAPYARSLVTCGTSSTSSP